MKDHAVNEQQLADLFCEHIDRMLAGEVSPTPPVEELSDLLNLGQQLAQANFRAGPVAQAAFQSQMAGWFGSVGSGAVPPTILGVSKGLFWLISIILMAVGIGLGLIVLVGSIYTGVIFTQTDETSPVSDGTEMPVLTTSEPADMPTSEATEPAASVSPTEIVPPIAPPQSDTIPAATSPRGDTVVIPTITPEPTTEAGEYPDDVIGGDGESGDSDHSSIDNDAPGEGDQDRGHGNDPDGIDEDNPGRSDDVGLGNGTDNAGGNKQGQSGGKGGDNKGGGKNN
ncbi:MAG: hypothetical protein JXM69_08075 [Anaerolineae bacterium]|nr:hypothetical protein [Anaerolineae bacterium]